MKLKTVKSKWSLEPDGCCIEQIIYIFDPYFNWSYWLKCFVSLFLWLVLKFSAVVPPPAGGRVHCSVCVFVLRHQTGAQERVCSTDGDDWRKGSSLYWLIINTSVYKVAFDGREFSSLSPLQADLGTTWPNWSSNWSTPSVRWSITTVGDKL